MLWDWMMSDLFDAALGIHPRALTVGARRLELLAENMANADTPHFKARDIDFRQVLSEAAKEAGSRLERSHPGHLTSTGASLETRYRVPNQPSLDGNSVDMDLEKAAFAEASVRYQASLDFLGSRVSGLRKALRGE